LTGVVVSGLHTLSSLIILNVDIFVVYSLSLNSGTHTACVPVADSFVLVPFAGVESN